MLCGHCVNKIATSLTDELAITFPEVNESSWFQQDGAISSTARVSICTVPITVSSPGTQTCQHVSL